MELLDFEMSADNFKREVKIGKRQREETEEEEKQNEAAIRAADKKQGQMLKRLKRTMFLEAEAEEGEESSEPMQIRFDDNDHLVPKFNYEF